MIRCFLLSLIANSVGIYLVDYFLGSFCFIDIAATTCPVKPEISLVAFVIGGFLLGILNTFIKPLLKLISLPITFLTAGLFMFVVNGIVLALLVWLINTMNFENIRILITHESNWVVYLYAAIILGLFNLSTHWLVKK
jgi:uncharacterized membrane protein YvlD (DUF360 family)